MAEQKAPKPDGTAGELSFLCVELRIARRHDPLVVAACGVGGERAFLEREIPHRIGRRSSILPRPFVPRPASFEDA